ncbi:hypothetical protein PHLCEN_2v6320 [Hermanssonia centrifuga]|uniref:Uncharacterized protein n=1 Tax=Hermanssonia centrifuga TaxID=98765 RepID=A0A2R6NZT7_9APHY|nr:hypothetical protein PHLCEN_2v6320 [Hermanssonia centrifuga]
MAHKDAKPDDVATNKLRNPPIGVFPRICAKGQHIGTQKTTPNFDRFPLEISVVLSVIS